MRVFILLLGFAAAFYDTYINYDEENQNRSFAYWEWSIREDQGHTLMPAMVRDFGPTVPWAWQRPTSTEAGALTNGISCVFAVFLALNALL
ncbi:Oidioi.mRNA.OKI2018_I69.chr2.g5084.t1.cds [Oikopleura dioica]|uniref:Oidioi.mRNA.OKI2018_I69.chr2.g5084.t1.cds n=1 Tax=Oikopleura dioica TaxID=34765 RepID=A0ABN7T8H8_OIKDI|nr:Oidioi.mRNA.OKI2018_I69.chr2.g5084.t1.cds [Oikopleura dioica]